MIRNLVIFNPIFGQPDTQNIVTPWNFVLQGNQVSQVIKICSLPCCTHTLCISYIMHVIFVHVIVGCHCMTCSEAEWALKLYTMSHILRKFLCCGIQCGYPNFPYNHIYMAKCKTTVTQCVSQFWGCIQYYDIITPVLNNVLYFQVSGMMEQWF